MATTPAPARARRTGTRRPAPARKALYLAGRNIFAERGYNGTTVDAIVDSAGLAKGAFYHHWASKDDLLREIMLDVMGVQMKLAAEAEQRDEPAATCLRRFIEDLFVIVVSMRKEVKIFHAEVSMLDRREFAEVKAQAEAFHRSARAIVTRGVEAGEFRNVESVELVTWVISGALSYAYRWWPLEEPQSPEEVGRMIGSLLMPGLESRT